MEILMYLFIFIIGLTIGSFLNVCIYRIPGGESIAFPPSHCPNCNKRIRYYDLIPVISYLILRGKCRYCGEKISVKYPLIELLTGGVFLIIFYVYGFSIESIKFMLFISYLIVVAFIDFKTTDVYLNTTITGILIGAIFVIYNYLIDREYMTYIIGALIGGGSIALIIITTKGMGWGDAEICLICGAFLGFKSIIVALFLAFLIGALTSVGLIALKIKSRKDAIPFGPFVALGALITAIFGNPIIMHYISWFNL